MKIKSMILSIVLAVALLGTLGIVFTDRVVAEPSAPHTITIDTCTETNFDNALAAAHSGDVIDVRCLTSFPVGPGVIAFSTQKTISKSITILGTHPVTGVNRLSGGDATRLFVVSAGKTLTLTDIALEHGFAASSGGCLEVFGSLVALTTTLQHCRSTRFLSFLGNGGAIYANTANVALTNTTLFSNTADDNGAGLYAYNSKVSGDRSRFDNNVADAYGGGLYQQLGSAHFDATTFTSNTTRYRGGGLYVTDVPTFYLQSNSRVEFNGATDLTDSLGGGAYFTASTPYIQDAFIVSNFTRAFYGGGGGIYHANGSLRMYTSVISDNHSRYGGGVYLKGSISNQSWIDSNLFYRNHAYYGGGLYNELYLLADNNQFSENDAYFGGGIRNDKTGILYLTNSLIDQNTAGSGAGASANGLINAFMNLTFTQNIAQFSGGGIQAGPDPNSSPFLIQGVTFLNNATANGDGGALYAAGNITVSLWDSTVVGNQVKHNGGGIWANGNGITLYIEDSAITDNKADKTDLYSSGGGIYLTGTVKVKLTNVNIDRNEISYGGTGGGMHLSGGTATFNNVTFNANKAASAAQGGGLYLENSTATINGLTASGNQGLESGGGLLTYQSTFTITNSTIDGNMAHNGGGIFNNQGTAQLINVTVSGNQATLQGGGLYNGSSGITLTNVTLKDNSAASGGALYNENGAGSIVSLKNSVVADSPSGNNCSGKVPSSAQYSLSTDYTCALSGTGNQNGVAAKLNALALVGGSTKVHLPLPGSPVIDMVFGSDFPGTDQRGVVRAQGLGADAGAVERQANDPIYALRVCLPVVIR